MDLTSEVFKEKKMDMFQMLSSENCICFEQDASTYQVVKAFGKEEE